MGPEKGVIIASGKKSNFAASVKALRRRGPLKIRFGSWQEWANAAFVFVALGAAVYSVEMVVWVSPQPSLLLTLLLAVLTTLVLSKSPLPSLVKHTGILLLGAGVFGWQLSSLVAPQPLWQALDVKPNENTVYFIAFLISGAWFVGYISTWFILQRHNPWVAVFLGAVVIMVNLNNLPPEEYYRFFPIYALASVLLIGQTNMARQLVQLKKCGQPYSKRGAIYYASTIVLLSVLIASSALFLPEVQLNPNSAISSKISWNNSQEQWFNIFAAVSGKLEHSRGEKQQNSNIIFGDPPSEDKTLQFMVSSDQVKYLHIRRYDNYQSNEWTSASTVDNAFDPGEGSISTKFRERKEFTYTVTNKMKTGLLLVAGEFKTASLPVLLRTFTTQPADAGLDEALDIISVTASRELPPNETYSVTSWISQATPIELYQAGTAYPAWVTSRYLQLPDTLSERVRELSQQLTEEAQTPYEKAVEIKKFLQRFTYSVVFNAPPTGVDAVDYFIFEKKAGDCTYFASAMAVMLRSVGVPTRISSGYYVDGQDKSSGQFNIRARDLHARAEVYFPRYGWIEFETTAGRPGLSAEDDFGDIELAVASKIAQNATQQVDVAFVNYDEEGNLLDEFGNPIYDDAFNIMALLPNMAVTPSPNTTPNISHNAMPGASRNTTVPLSPNTTANQSHNATSAMSPNATRPLSPNATPVTNKGNTARIVFPGTKVLLYPAFLVNVGLISLLIFVLGAATIFLYYRWLDRIKRSEDVGRVYALMCRLASLVKAGPKPVETPFEYGLRLALAFPAQGETIGSITRIYAESRFSKHKDLSQTRKAELERSWLQLYPVMVKRVLRLR